MRTGRIGLAAGCVALSLAACSPAATDRPTPTPTPTPTPPPPPGQFPDVVHHAGAEHILTAAEVDTASSQGITLSMNYGNVSGTLASEMQAKGTKYLDRTIADDLYTACGWPTTTCSLSTTQEDALLAQVNTYLNANKSDPLIAGYYVLDDFPGNVSHALQRITAAVHTITPNKPTVCAFGASTDFWPTSDHTNAPYTAHAGIDQSIGNYTPTGCDLTDFYIYGVGDVPSLTSAPCIPTANNDWTMAGVIPYLKSLLTARGWNPATGFVISPQTFDIPSEVDGTTGCTDYVNPTAASIETQTAAACTGGAVATLAYIWDQFGSGGYLANRADWQTGYQAGNNTCKTIWGS
jgi:hypothetical protein